MCPEKNQWHQFIIPKLKNENFESTICIGWPLNLSSSIATVTGKMDSCLFEVAAIRSPQCEKSCCRFRTLWWLCPEKNQWHQFIFPKTKHKNNFVSTIFISWPLNLSPSIAMVTGKMGNGLFEAAAVKSPRNEKSCSRSHTLWCLCPEKNQWYWLIFPKIKHKNNFVATIFIGWPLNLSQSIAMVTDKMDNGLFEAAAVQSPRCEKSCCRFHTLWWPCPATHSWSTGTSMVDPTCSSCYKAVMPFLKLWHTKLDRF